MTQYNTSAQQVNIYDQPCQLRLVAPNCWTVDDCFSSSTLSWMQNIMTNEHNQFAVSRPHHRLLLTPCEDHAQLQSIGLAMIPMLNSITGENLNLMVAKYWIDLPGFACQVHSDAADIIVSYQIYIDVTGSTGQESCHGVEFLHVDPPYEVDLRVNHGYINLNSDLKPHRVCPGSGTRTSVTFQFNRCAE